MAFGKAGDYKEAQSQNVMLWDEIAVRNTVDADNHTVGLRSDGTVVAVGWDYYGQCEVSDWTDILVPQNIT